MKFTTGAVFGNRYTLGERIAVGGMGEVWEATDQVLGRIVAIKLLSPGLADQEGFAQRFREEARNTAALSHPNIAAVYDYGEDAGANWLVMELVKGQPLSAIIAENGRLSAERTISIVSQAAHALQAAHDRGVIHRDVKPANILVKPSGEVKLTDFGISRATDAVPITRTGEVMGTAQYISPEQATGQPVSPASDIYALGCVAYEMLTGTRPFDEGSPVATAMAHVTTPPPPLPDTVPPALAAVIMACLAKAPSERPRSARALADTLRGAPTGGFPVTAPMAATERLSPATRVAPAGAAVPPRRTTRVQETPAEEPKRKKNPLFWIIPLVLLLVVGAFLIAQALGDGSRDTTPTPAPTTATQSPTPTQTETTDDSVQVTASDYMGLSYDEAAQRLQGLGLQARRGAERENEAPRGQVIGLSPSGRLDRNSTVTLDVSSGPAPEETPTPTQTQTPTEAPPQETEAPPTEDPQPPENSEPEAPATGAQGTRGPGGPAGAGVGVDTERADPTPKTGSPDPDTTSTPEE